MEKKLNVREQLTAKLKKLKPIFYLVLVLRAVTADNLFAQTKNPSDHFDIPFGNFAMENVPENLDYHYWIDRLEKTDNLAILAIEFESFIQNIPIEIKANAEQNYENLFQEILNEINSNQVEGRKEKLKILIEKIKSFNLRAEVDGLGNQAVTLVDFLTQAQNEKIICTPATVLALDCARRLGIDGLKTAITFKHVFIYDEVQNLYLDLNDEVIFKNEAEAKNIRGEELQHEGIYLLEDKNILGVLASNMIYDIAIKDPYFQNKNKMLYDLSYHLGNPGISFDYALKLKDRADKENNPSEQDHLYKKALQEAEKINQTAFSFQKTKKLVSALREKIKEKYLSSSID